MKEIYRWNKVDGIYQTELAKRYKVDRSTIIRAIKTMEKLNR